MAIRQSGNFTAALRYYFTRWGNSPVSPQLHDIDNNTALTWSDSGDTTSIHGLNVDTDGLVRLNRQAFIGAKDSRQFYMNANSSIANQIFYIATRPTVITSIQYNHSTAGTSGSAVTAYVVKCTGTQAITAGATVMSGTFNCKGTANTEQDATLLSVDAYGQPNAGIVLAAGDRLGIIFTGTLTSLAGVVLTVNTAPGFKEEIAAYNMQANASLATQAFFMANRDYTISGVRVVWGTAATDSGTVTIDVTHETGTTAPGSGSSILASALSVKTTANTVATPTLTSTTSRLSVNAGDRLSVKYTGTLTALAGVVVEVLLTAVGQSNYVGQSDVTFSMLANGSQGTQGFWIADRDYEVVDFGAVWGTAGTDGGAVTLDCTIDKGVVAPGAGNSCLAGTVNVKATANTATFPGITTTRYKRLISKGDLVSVKTAGTLTSLAGVNATLSLLPR